MANLDGVVAMEPYVYDVILQCRECRRIDDRAGGEQAPLKLSRFRGRARTHTRYTGHEVEVIVGRVHPYKLQKGG